MEGVQKVIPTKAVLEDGFGCSAEGRGQPDEILILKAMCLCWLKTLLLMDFLVTGLLAPDTSSYWIGEREERCPMSPFNYKFLCFFYNPTPTTLHPDSSVFCVHMEFAPHLPLRGGPSFHLPFITQVPLLKTNVDELLKLTGFTVTFPHV